MRRTAWVMITGSLVVGVGLAIISIHALQAPHSPSPSYLAKSGIDVRPIRRHEPISKQRAQQIAHSSCPALKSLGPTSVELVSVSLRNLPQLRTPRAAWLVTWNQTSNSQGPGPGVVYHHMNELVNAKTGQVLLIFPSR